MACPPVFTNMEKHDASDRWAAAIIGLPFRINTP
jgi:hypothetical protein